MEDFGEEKNVRDCQKYLVVDEPSPFSKAGFIHVTHEKCPSGEIGKANTMGSQRQ